MFSTIMYGMVMGAVFILFFEFFVPITLFPEVKLMMQVLAIILIFIGVGLFHARTVTTQGSKLLPLPNPNYTLCFHQGKSGVKIIRAKKEEPNRLRAKTKRGWMNIKDTGGTMNMAGHDLAITSQDDGHNYPLYIVDAVAKWKDTWGVRNENEFDKLYDQLSKVEYYEDLEKIEFLKPILADPDKKQAITDMDLDDIRNMRELLFDGRTIDVKAYLDWSEGATPYDNEAIISSSVARIRAEDRSLVLGNMPDYTKYIIPMIILFIGAAIAVQILGGGGG